MHWSSSICVLFCALVTLVCGCGSGDIAHAARYYEKTPEKGPVESAVRCIDQKEDWGDKAEYAVAKAGDGWVVTAWRVEYPTAKGPDRYKPWGFRVITLDRDGQVTGYRAAKS